MKLKYHHKSNGGEWEPVEMNVQFGETQCNYGGTRKWFICPNMNCRKRVAVLYGTGKYFLCRHCYSLVYSSQQESEPDRLIRKARKIRARLEASNNLFEPIWFKPKNMHLKTFDRLRREADYASDRSLIIGAQRLGISPTFR